MALTVTVVPASTSAGRETVRHLLASNINVRGIYRNPSKAPTEFQQSPNFAAVQGDVQDGESIDFTGSEAVFYVPPPTYDGTDLGDFATKGAENIRAALQKASVRRIVVLSALGSQHDHGVGILKINHITDQILKSSVPEAIFLRPSYFYEDWASQIPTLKSDTPTITSVFTPLDFKVPMLSVQDVGLNAARSLTGPRKTESPYFYELYGPKSYSTNEVRDTIEQVIGKKVEINAITPDKLREHVASQVPESIVDDVVGITTATLPGGLIGENLPPSEGPLGREGVRGEITLLDVFKTVFGALKG